MSDIYDVESHIKQIVDQAKITTLVKKALDNDQVTVTEWSWKSLLGSGGGIGNSGIFRFTGTCFIDEKSYNWSVILKIVRYQADAEPSSSHYWKREFDAYESGWLNNLPTNTLSAPTCYATDVFEGEAVWLWLEDIQTTQEKWTQHDLAIVARHLGQFNGYYFASRNSP